MAMWKIPSQTLVIEMTETASIDSMDTAGRFMANLQTMAYASASTTSHRLLITTPPQRFQIDAIKIDRSFVVSAANDPAKIPIVAGIIALARGLNAEVIAEGIETIEQRELISDLGCARARLPLRRPMSATTPSARQRTIAPAEKIS